MENLLFYKSEAECFEQAFPLGNGRLGALVYGGKSVEKISLNIDSLYSGSIAEKKAPENASLAFEKVRKLCLDGDDVGARNGVADFLGEEAESYMPLSALLIKLNHDNATDYSRSLFLDKGTAVVKYFEDGVKYRREMFVSKDFECAVLHFSSDKKGKQNMRVSFEMPLKTVKKEFVGNKVVFDGEAPVSVKKEKDDTVCIYSQNGESISYTNVFRFDVSGGKSGFDGDEFFVENGDEVTIYIFAETGVGTQKGHRDICLERADGELVFENIKKAHEEDFSSLYNRTSLSLTDTEKSNSELIPTDERLLSFDGEDLGMYELLFNYGRYLMISASRAGSSAMNLQGIWNESLCPPWNSAYTLNINAEMNYWPAHITGLGECFEPFIELCEKLCETGKKTAKEYYSASGFVCHHNSDIWGLSSPVGKGQSWAYIWAFWNMASGWISCQLFDEYEYTLDLEKLRNRIYPIMRSATEFYLCIMVKDKNGKYIISPSTSPENKFLLDDGSASSVSITTTMTASIVYELFEKIIKCTYLLDTDYELRKTLESILPELYTLRINSDGRLSEWYEERTEVEVEHRHVSHLFGLYPGTTISKEKTPELAEACKKSLLTRGDVGTGWSLAWKVCLWARLCDGNHALKVLRRQLKYVDPKEPLDYVNGGGTYPNLMDAHPPFQIDGNMGVCAGISEMLMQSEMGKITLLPALPDKFRDGHFCAFKAKGNITVSAWWKNGRIEKALFSSPIEQRVEVVAQNKVYNIDVGEKEITLYF